MYLKAKYPTPLLNTPDFRNVFGEKALSLDEQGLLRAVEMVALPGTLFEVVGKHPHQIVAVKTNEYPGGPYYIDARFTEKSGEQEREQTLPPKEEILHKLQASLGLPYTWGGNWGQGLSEMEALYGLRGRLQGVDCSGLLYEATSGCTPRNSSWLLSFGKEVPHGEKLKPLDLIVWKGHVIIALDADQLIESELGKGVVTSPFTRRWPEIAHHNPVIRRFYNEKTPLN